MEGINNRQKNLIKLLVQNDDFLPVSHYAKLLSKTNRTIFSDLEKIQELFDDLQADVTINRKPRVGIKLEGIAENKMMILKQIEATKNFTDFGPLDRQMEITKLLLIDEAVVTHQSLSDQFHVSASSIGHDLEKINESYSVSLVSSKKGTWIEASEEVIQRSIFRFCENYLYYKGIDNEQVFEEQGEELLSGLFDRRIVKKLFIEVQKMEEDSEFQIPQQYKKSILLNLIVFFFRLQKGHHVCDKKEFLFNQIQSLDTYYLANELVETVAKQLDLTYGEQDVSYVNRQLLGYGVKMKLAKQYAYEKFEAIINKMFIHMSEIMHVDFSKDKQLKTRFSKHFIPMIYRSKMGIETTNPLLSEIKNQYSIIFSATWYAMASIEEELNIKFSEDEVAFLAMYFQVSLEKSQHGKKILIVCPTGVGTSELIFSRIKRVLPAQDTAEVTTIQSLYQSSLDSVDLIISSVPLNDINKPVIQVSPLITEEDIKNISALYSDFFFNQENTNKHPATEQFPFLKDIIDQNYIATNLKFESKEDCLNYMIDILEEKEVVTKDFRQEVFQRERLGETALDTGVAIPHAAPQNVLLTKIFIVTLDKSILWNNKKVSYVLLICVSKRERKLLKGAITDVHKLVKSEDNVKFFLSKEKPEKIYQTIAGGSFD